MAVFCMLFYCHSSIVAAPPRTVIVVKSSIFNRAAHSVHRSAKSSIG